MSPKPIETYPTTDPFRNPDVPMLAQVQERIASDATLTATRRRDIASAINLTLDRRDHYTIPLEQFPASFQADLAAYLEHVGSPKPFGKHRPPRRFSPATI